MFPSIQIKSWIFGILLISVVFTDFVYSQGKCLAPTDIVLVTDGSTSVSPSGFNSTINWLIEMENIFEMGPNHANIAVLQVSTDIFEEVPFEDDASQYLLLVKNMTWTCSVEERTVTGRCPPGIGHSYIGNGMYEAGLLLEANTRARSSCVALLISDGSPSSGDRPMNDPDVIPKIKNDLGCSVITIGVGFRDQSAIDFLTSIASNDTSNPGQKLYIDGQDFELDSSLPIIREVACQCIDDCSGNGVCQSNGTCSCNDNFSGDNCAITCDDCSGNGVCQSNGVCSCNDNFSGDNCEIACGQCSGNGVCQSNGLCLCNDNFSGDDCEITCDDCSGNGVCQSNGVCLCLASFTGDNCEITCDDCSGNGECSPDGSCSCNPSYSGDNCEICEDCESVPLATIFVAAGVGFGIAGVAFLFLFARFTASAATPTTPTASSPDSDVQAKQPLTSSNSTSPVSSLSPTGPKSNRGRGKKSPRRSPRRSPARGKRRSKSPSGQRRSKSPAGQRRSKSPAGKKR